MPVLREIGTDQEEAAATLGAGAFQTFWRITLPAIRWGLVYGVILTTARSIGEYGAVAVVSGKIAGRTETGDVVADMDRMRAFYDGMSGLKGGRFGPIRLKEEEHAAE